MSKETVASLSVKLDSMLETIELLADIITADHKAVDKAGKKTSPTKTENKFSDDFSGRWNTQLPRAIALAKKKGSPVELAAVPKNGTFQCWYYTQGSRKLSMDSRKLAVIHNDGRIESLTNLGNLKVA